MPVFQTFTFTLITLKYSFHSILHNFYLKCSFKTYQPNSIILCYLLSASDRSPVHQSSDQAGVLCTTFSGMNIAEATPTSLYFDQLQPQTALSSASQQRPEEDATIPDHVLISNPGSILKAQNQENNVPSTTHLHVVAMPISYSSSVDMFHHLHPTCSSSMNYPLAPLLVPFNYTSQSQLPSFKDMPQSFLGPSPVCTQTLASYSPVFSVLPAQTVGLYSSACSNSSLVQNQSPERSSDFVPVQRQAASDGAFTEPPSFQLCTSKRYIEPGMFYESTQYYPNMHKRYTNGFVKNLTSNIFCHGLAVLICHH